LLKIKVGKVKALKNNWKAWYPPIKEKVSKMLRRFEKLGPTNWEELVLILAK